MADKITRDAASTMGSVLRKGLVHYGRTPVSTGIVDQSNVETPVEGLIAFIVWTDPDANFVTAKGDGQQEFYIFQDGNVKTYNGTEFLDTAIKKKNWDNFCNRNAKVFE